MEFVTTVLSVKSTIRGRTADITDMGPHWDLDHVQAKQSHFLLPFYHFVCKQYSRVLYTHPRGVFFFFFLDENQIKKIITPRREIAVAAASAFPQNAQAECNKH